MTPHISVYIVSPSEDTKLRMPEKQERFADVSIEVIRNNKDSLPVVYNRKLAEVRAMEQKPDFVIFMHHDVDVDFKHLVQHIEECSEKYDVMGLCGCEVLDTKKSPLNWYTGSNDYPKRRWGCVTHGELNNTMSYFSFDRPNVTDHAVGCIDGLMIIFGPKAIASEMKFDETFLFHQYDTDISLQAQLTYKLRLGVLVETSLHHYSVGRGILKPEFLVHEKDLREKWGMAPLKAD